MQKQPFSQTHQAALDELLHSADTVEQIEDAIRSGANPNSIDSYGDTKLHSVWSHRLSLPLAQALIRLGADVNARDARHATPLFRPCAHGSFELVELLIASGADVNARDATGSTPLHQAMPRKNDYVDALGLWNECYVLTCSINHVQNNPIARLLLAHGADVNAVDQHGRTPLHYSVTRCVTELLIEHGANPMIKDHNGHTALDFLASESVWSHPPPNQKPLVVDIEGHQTVLAVFHANATKALIERELALANAPLDGLQNHAHKRTRRM